MNILSLWLKGMSIIIQFLFLIAGMIVIAALIYLLIDSIVEEMTGKSMLANILFDCRT